MGSNRIHFTRKQSSCLCVHVGEPSVYRENVLFTNISTLIVEFLVTLEVAKLSVCHQLRYSIRISEIRQTNTDLICYNRISHNDLFLLRKQINTFPFVVLFDGLNATCIEIQEMTKFELKSHQNECVVCTLFTLYFDIFVVCCLQYILSFCTRVHDASIINRVFQLLK